MKKSIILVFALAVLAALTVSFFSWKMIFSNRRADSNKPAPVLIGFSQGSILEERWKTDSALFIEKAKSLGANVKHVISENNPEKQITQIEDLIKEGAKVIVIIPSDSEKIAPAIEKAKAAGVKTVAYDRLIKNSNLDFYVSFDNVKVGELQAQGVLAAVDTGKFAYIGGSPTDNNAFLVKDGSINILKPKIDKGDISLVIDEYMNNWDPEEAYKTVKSYLASGKKLDAIVAANDGTASGAIRALAEYDLAGSIPVSGQDADLAACQRIVAGTQTVTVYKPIKAIAEEAAKIAFTLALGRKPEANSIVANGKLDVPSYLLSPTLVNKDNIKATIISDNFHSYEDVYGESVK